MQTVEEARGTERQPKLPVGARIKRSLRARWIGYPIIIILCIVAYIVGLKSPNRDRFFVERDPTLSYPYRNDTVPNWALAFTGGIGPIFLIILTQALIRKSAAREHWDARTKDIHLSIIVLGEVLAVTYLIMEILKVYVGRLRPDFFAYCDYKGYRAAVNSGDLTEYLSNTVPGQIGSYSNCRQDNNDAHYSFPSGHAAISFCGLTFLTLFLIHVTGRINYRHHNVGKAIRFFIFLIPLFGAILIAATRVIDYKHFVEDTIWGAFIGVGAAFLAFHANYGYARPDVPGVPIMMGDLRSSNNNFAPPLSSSANGSLQNVVQMPVQNYGTTANGEVVSLPNTLVRVNIQSPLVTRMVPKHI